VYCSIRGFSGLLHKTSGSRTGTINSGIIMRRQVHLFCIAIFMRYIPHFIHPSTNLLLNNNDTKIIRVVLICVIVHAPRQHLILSFHVCSDEDTLKFLRSNCAIKHSQQHKSTCCFRDDCVTFQLMYRPGTRACR
jgi:hypothetical protein